MFQTDGSYFHLRFLKVTPSAATIFATSNSQLIASPPLLPAIAANFNQHNDNNSKVFKIVSLTNISHLRLVGTDHVFIESTGESAFKLKLESLSKQVVRIGFVTYHRGSTSFWRACVNVRGGVRGASEWAFCSGQLWIQLRRVASGKGT